MKLKSKLRLALELGLVTSALPLLLLGCGGGGGGSGNGGVQGQFWTDLTGTGLRDFYPGDEPASGVAGYYSGFYAGGSIETATFSGGSYFSSLTPKNMTASGVWGAGIVNAYYLAASGWTPDPLSAVLTATDATHFSATNVLTGTTQVTITTINLSGMPIVASSAVPAVTAQGMASAVLPASAVYPSGSYEFVSVSSSTISSPGYQLWTGSEYAVTSTAGPLSGPLDLNTFRTTYTTTANPICVNGRAWVHTGTGNTYAGYALTFKSPSVATGTMKTCLNADIAAGTGSNGTYDLSLVYPNGTTPIITFTNPTGSYLSLQGDPFGGHFIGLSPADNTAYIGSVFPAGTTTDTSYQLNKTAMDAALQAWGMPTF